MRRMIWLLTLISLLATGASAYAGGPEEGYGPGPWMTHWSHGGWWWIFPAGMFVVMLIVCFLFFGRRGGWSSWCGSGEQKDTDSPLDVLKKRYAKGEISKEEFEKIKKDLN